MAEFGDDELGYLYLPVPEDEQKASKKSESKLSKNMERALKAAVDVETKAETKTSADPDEPDDATGETRALKVAALRAQIRAYKEHKRFGESLTQSGFDFAAALRKKTPRELRKELKKIDKLLVKKSGIDPIDMGAHSLLGIGESLGVKAGYKVEGLTAACFGSDSWQYTFERVKLKYGLSGIGSGFDPLIGLALATGNIALTLHYSNSQKEELKPMIADLEAKLNAPLPDAQPTITQSAAPTAQQAIQPVPGAAAPGMLKPDGSPLTVV
jgi:hypothetical protein